jgi:hypothetical protein
MTMKREAKAEALINRAETLSGAKVIPSYSPRQYRTYGRTLPAQYAAEFMFNYDRGIKAISRERWAEIRIGRRRQVRVA